MGHSSSEVGVLKKFEEIKAVWIPVTDHKHKKHKKTDKDKLNSIRYYTTHIINLMYSGRCQY